MRFFIINKHDRMVIKNTDLASENINITIDQNLDLQPSESIVDVDTYIYNLENV